MQVFLSFGLSKCSLSRPGPTSGSSWAICVACSLRIESHGSVWRGSPKARRGFGPHRARSLADGCVVQSPCALPARALAWQASRLAESKCFSSQVPTTGALLASVGWQRALACQSAGPTGPAVSCERLAQGCPQIVVLPICD